MSALEQRHVCVSQNFPFLQHTLGAGRTTLWYYFVYIWNKFPVQFPFKQSWFSLFHLKWFNSLMKLNNLDLIQKLVRKKIQNKTDEFSQRLSECGVRRWMLH